MRNLVFAARAVVFTVAAGIADVAAVAVTADTPPPGSGQVPSPTAVAEVTTVPVAEPHESPPPATLLAPGPHGVGFEMRLATDPNRTFTTAAGQVVPRPVRIFFWFPTVASPTTPTMPFQGYVEAEGRGLDDLAGRLAEAAGGNALGSAEVAAVRSSPTLARLGASPQNAAPLVLLGGALNGIAYLSSTLAEHLASHGYTVAALSSTPEREGGRLGFDKVGLGHTVDDLLLALRLLSADPRVSSDRFAAVGWSVGGVALAAIAAREPRMAALVSLDSGLSYNYGPPLLEAFGTPQLERPLPLLDIRCLVPGRFVVPRSESYFAAAKGPVQRLELAAASHVTCTSLGMMASDPHRRGQDTTRRDAFRTLTARILSFFEQTLRGAPTAS